LQAVKWVKAIRECLESNRGCISHLACLNSRDVTKNYFFADIKQAGLAVRGILSRTPHICIIVHFALLYLSPVLFVAYVYACISSTSLFCHIILNVEMYAPLAP
jgi:hypothetical protein